MSHLVVGDWHKGVSKCDIGGRREIPDVTSGGLKERGLGVCGNEKYFCLLMGDEEGD